MESLTLSSALAYYHEDEDIKAELTKAEFNLLVNPELDYLKLLRSALEFQGFDPKVILRQLVRNRKAYMEANPTRQEWDLNNAGDDFKVHDGSELGNIITNQQSLAKDLEFLIMMFLLRNNHISKIIKKSISGLSDILEMFKQKYEINDETRASGTQLGSRDITLPRIAGVLPSVAVRMFHMRAVKETVPYHSIPGVVELLEGRGAEATGSRTVKVITTSELSHAICCPFLPSLHPKKTEKAGHIHAIMLFVAIRLDDIIQKKEKNFTPLDELLNYYKAGFESAATPEASRLEVMSKVKLFYQTKIYPTDEALFVNTKCCEALETMRVEDPSHSLLMVAARTGSLPN
ncbi:unnamed protein product, partial [Brenthis ino]